MSMDDERPAQRDEIAARYRRIAPLYDLVDFPFEYLRYRRLRRELTHGLRGRVLEPGVGTGRNLTFYSEGCTVTGLDLSDAMLDRAESRARKARADVRLLHGDVSATGFPDAAFDAVVASFVLCVLPPDRRLSALRELARVCAPEGEIRLLEYSRSAKPWRRAVMRLWEPWVQWAFGADFDVDLDHMLPAAGLAHYASRYLVSDIIRLVTVYPQHTNPSATPCAFASQKDPASVGADVRSEP